MSLYSFFLRENISDYKKRVASFISHFTAKEGSFTPRVLLDLTTVIEMSKL